MQKQTGHWLGEWAAEALGHWVARAQGCWAMEIQGGWAAGAPGLQRLGFVGLQHQQESSFLLEGSQKVTPGQDLAEGLAGHWLADPGV